MSAYDDLEPRPVWQIFGEISKVPRCSGQEQAVMERLRQWAAERGLGVRTDAVGNTLVEIPGSPGKEKLPPVLIQGHVDMVCEKNAATKHDFARDPIRIVVDGDWVRADGTTLGSDNGIGVAMGLAVAEQKGLVHPPVEVLLTIDEERGLTGAAGVEPGFFKAKRMINLDSEEDDALFIGCAGGRDTILVLEGTQGRAPKNAAPRKVTIGGLKGGHSGLDIHRGRGNAVKILARALLAAGEEMDVRVVTIAGGSKRNAIPREAAATVFVPQEQSRRFKKLVEETVARILSEELTGVDDGLTVKVTAVQAARGFSLGSSRQVLDLLGALPSGVLAMSRDLEGLVETSTNLGVVETDGARVRVICCSRSSVMSALDGVVRQHAALGRLAGAAVDQPPGYPGWQPSLKSDLLDVTRRMYAETFGQDVELKAIHAGLECGLLTEKYPDLDIVSFGPTIEGAHSPDERVSIASVGRIWRLLTAVLADLAG